MWGQNANMEIRLSSGNIVLDWGSNEVLTGPNPFSTAGKWYFLAITWDEDIEDLRLYFGDETTPPSYEYATASQNFTVSTVGIRENLFMNSSGGDLDQEYIVDGKGADLRYYNIAKTNNDILEDYNNRLSGDENGLRSYFPLQADLADAGPLKVTAHQDSKGVSPEEYSGWSTESPASFNTCPAPAATYDDNRHGAGSGTANTPMNSLKGFPNDNSDAYYPKPKEAGEPNWLEDDEPHLFRMELIRPLVDDPVGSGVYKYQFKVWVLEPNDLSAEQLGSFQNVKSSLPSDWAWAPLIQKTIDTMDPTKNNPLDLSTAVHEDLKKILFGFTEGTGGATQNVTLRDFEIYFLKQYPTGYPDAW
jgi:hypothetical protein